MLDFTRFSPAGGVESSGSGDVAVKVATLTTATSSSVGLPSRPRPPRAGSSRAQSISEMIRNFPRSGAFSSGAVGKVGVVGALELALILEKPVVAPPIEAGRWSFSPVFSDPAFEHEFLESSARDFLLRVIPLSFVGLCASLGILIVGDIIMPEALMSISFICGFVFIFTVSLHLTKCPYLLPARLIVEICVCSSLLALLLGTPMSGPGCTCIILTYLFVSLVILNPSFYSAIANLTVAVAVFTVVAAQPLPYSTNSGPRTVFVDFALIVVAMIMSIILWRDSDVADRISFSNERQFEGTWRAMERVLAAALPRQILSALMTHVVKYHKSTSTGNREASILVSLTSQKSNCDWSSAPATAEPDVTILSVYFPDLSHHIFAKNPVEAVAQLSSLWALCDKTATALGVTTLELANTEFVGVLGLGNEGLPKDNAIVAVRAGLAIVAALPPEFAAVALIGVHAGPVVSGFVGSLRPHFTLVGDTMGMTARITRGAQLGSVTVSATIKQRVGDLFESTERTVNIEGPGRISIYEMARERDGPAQVLFEPLTLHAAIEQKKLSSRIAQTTFGLREGFADKGTEARYAGLPMPVRNTQILAVLLVASVAFELTNNGISYNEAFSLTRTTINGVALLATVILAVAVYLNPRSPFVVRASTTSYVVCILFAPFVAQIFWSSLLSVTLLVFVPLNHLKPFQLAILCFTCAAITSALALRGFYFSINRVVETSSITNIMIFWMYLQFSFAVFGSFHLDVRNRTRFAHAEALVAAQDVGGIVLKHLLPVSLLSRLTAGNELHSHAILNVDVAVLVADIADLTATCSVSEGPSATFDLINAAFAEFERISHAVGAYKVKTVGNCIIFSAGLCEFPCPAVSRAARVALMLRLARGIHGAAAHLRLRMRIGVHVGALVSGVMKTRGLVHDVWGEAILGARAAEAVAPLGGTAFTAEAVAELDPSIKFEVRHFTPDTQMVCGVSSATGSCHFCLFEPIESRANAASRWVGRSLEGEKIEVKIADLGGEWGRGASMPKLLTGDETTKSGVGERDVIVTSGGSCSGTDVGIMQRTDMCSVCSFVGFSKSEADSRYQSRASSDATRIPSEASSVESRYISRASPEKDIFGVGEACGLDTWSWDVLSENEGQLPALAMELLRPSLACGLVSGEAATIVIAKLCASYKCTPFHNAFHGVLVMQVATMLARTVPAVRSLLSDFDIFLLAIASLGHDAGHTGFTNAHEIATRSTIALAYGMEGPVLESFHSAITTEILEESGALTLLSHAGRAKALLSVTATIMASDMQRHGDIMRSLRGGSLNALSIDALNGVLVAAADSANYCFPHAISIKWADRIAEEFIYQTAVEGLLGLPKTPYMVGFDKPLVRARMQIAYSSYVAAPLWRALATFADDSLAEPLRNLANNERFYLLECQRLAPVPVSVRTRLAAYLSKCSMSLLVQPLPARPFVSSTTITGTNTSSGDKPAEGDRKDVEDDDLNFIELTASSMKSPSHSIYVPKIDSSMMHLSPHDAIDVTEDDAVPRPNRLPDLRMYEKSHFSRRSMSGSHIRPTTTVDILTSGSQKTPESADDSALVSPTSAAVSPTSAMKSPRSPISGARSNTAGHPSPENVLGSSPRNQTGRIFFPGNGGSLSPLPGVNQGGGQGIPGKGQLPQ